MATAAALYCECGGGIAALDPATGAVRCRYSLAGVQRLESSHPAVADGVVYLEGDERILTVVATIGAVLWRSPTLVNQSNATLSLFVVLQVHLGCGWRSEGIRT
jgi:hypothetical protein